MNKEDINKYELIEKFNSGELTGTELSEFLQRIKDDPELAFEVEFSRKIDNFFIKNKDKIELREQLEQIYETTILAKKKSMFVKFNKQTIINLKKTYKIAACIILLLALGISIFFIFRPSKNERLYSEYFKVYDSGYTVRGIDMSVKDKFHIAMDAYDNNDFVNSSILLKEVCKSEPDNIEALFYKGISEMKNKSFDDAILSLNTVVEDSTTLFRESAVWYLALCYLEKNDLLNTKITLHKIIDAPNDSYKKQAAFLLKDLE